MAIYEIAKLRVRIEAVTEQTELRLQPYLTDGVDFDFDASTTMAEIEEYMAKSDIPTLPYLAEDAIVLTKISRTVLDRYDGCFFHSSSLEIDGKGYMFTALSGTGKSTHTRNWRRLFGDRVTMINDDKPIIRKIDGRFFVCGTPWMGKSDIGCNRTAPIKAIYILQRGEENTAKRISPGSVFKQLLEATLFPKTRENMQKLLSIFNELFSAVPLFLLTCNKDTESAQVAYDAANQK